MDNHYAILGISETATNEEIKRAFRGAAFECHPDRNQGNKDKEAQFRRVQEACDILCDPKKRTAHDQALKKERMERAQKDWAETVKQWLAQPAPQVQEPLKTATPPQVPPKRPPPTQTAGKVPAWLKWGLGAAAVLGFASAAVHNAGTTYDPGVDRNRGPDGRFRRS